MPVRFGPVATSTLPRPLTDTLTNGELTMDFDAADQESGNFTQTPASGQMLLSFFRASSSWANVSFITAAIAGVAPASLTGVYAALYSYDGSSNLTRMDLTADQHTTWTGTYSVHKMALTGGTSSISAGNLYAIGLLQVGTTPGSLMGASGYIPFLFGQSGASWRSGVLTGQTTPPASTTTGALVAGSGPWRMLASVTTS